jgi:hypothetical protein
VPDARMPERHIDEQFGQILNSIFKDKKDAGGK